MCDCCDDDYCGGCGKTGGEADFLYAITPYVSAVRTKSGLSPDVTPPLVTLAEAKQHCRIDIDDDDTLIQSYIDAALDYVTSRTGVSLALTKNIVKYSAFPEGRTPIVPPFVNFTPYTSPAETLIQYVDTSGVTHSLTLGSGIGTITDVNPTPFIPIGGQDWPTDYEYSETARYITLVYYTTANGSYFAANPQFKVVVLMLVAHWYNAREPVTTGSNAANRTVPYTLDVLLSQNTEITF